MHSNVASTAFFRQAERDFTSSLRRDRRGMRGFNFAAHGPYAPMMLLSLT